MLGLTYFIFTITEPLLLVASAFLRRNTKDKAALLMTIFLVPVVLFQLFNQFGPKQTIDMGDGNIAVSPIVNDLTIMAENISYICWFLFALSFLYYGIKNTEEKVS